MNRRDHVQRTLQFEEVHPVPYTLWYDSDSEARLTEHYGSDDWKLRIQNSIHRYTLVWEPETNIDEDHYHDLHGTVWQRGSPIHVTEPALGEPTLAGYGIPSYLPYLHEKNSQVIDTTHGVVPTFRFEELESRLLADRGEAFTVVSYGPGLLERGWMIRGFEGFLMDLALYPEFVRDLLDLILERELELLEAVCRLPVDGILFVDDWGDQQGVTIGPERWRQYLKPRVKILYERAHELGKWTFQHTCGNVLPLVPDLIEMGLDCLQSLQPEAMPVYELKEKYGQSLALWGGLGTQALLPRGTPDEIRAEVRKLKRRLGSGGGYVFTTSKPIMRDVPLANAVALVEATLED